MISTEVEARATLPTYMTYPDTWRTKQQPPEFLRPAPKPLTQLRYNGISSSLINGHTNTHHSQPPQQQSPPTVVSGRSAPCLPPPPNVPPTPSPSPSTPTIPSSTNTHTIHSGSRSNSSSPVNLSATHKLDDDPSQNLGLTDDHLQYTAYRIFAPAYVPSPYHASSYAVYAAAAAAAASPYALLPPHHPAAPRTTTYIPTGTIAPPLSPLIDPATYSLTTANGTYLSPTSQMHQALPQLAQSGPGGSITSGTSAKASVGGSITSGTSLLRERRPPGVVAGGSSQFKIPSGKEGSLKHRILQTRSDDQVLDLQHRVDGPNIVRKRLCATLSPPPPTLAPPQVTPLPPQQHIPYPLPQTTITPPAHKLQHHQIYTSPISPPSPSITQAQTSLPPGPGCNGVKQQPFVSGPLFTRGTFIQLGGGELRRVEDMRTEDFVQSAERSAELRLAESTVVKIAENRATGGAKVTLSYNERRTQVTQIAVESSWDHPYFVMGASWASCKPELTYQYYGLRVSRLQVGDVLVSLTPRETPITPTIPNHPANMPQIKRESTAQFNSSNVNNYNSHFRSPNSSQNPVYVPYSTSAAYQQHSLLLRNGVAAHSVGGSVGMGNTTITTVTGTAMTARPGTYAHVHAPIRLMHAHQTHGPAQHQLPVAVVPGLSGGNRNSRSMSPDSLARKRRWSVPDQLSDDEQQPISRRSKTE